MGWFINGALTQITNYIAIKTTFGKNTLGHQDVGTVRYCGMTPACSNGVTPACGYPSWTFLTTTSQICPLYAVADFLAARTSTTGPWFCTIGPAEIAYGPGYCDP